jgi:hypothetical protein
LYFPTKGVKGVTRLELNVLEALVIFLNAEDSFKLSEPILPKLKKFKIFLLSNGKRSK